MPGNEDLFQKALNEGHSAAWDQDWERAAQAYRRAVEEFPDRAKGWTNLGLALMNLHRHEEALQAYQRAAALAPNDPLPFEKIAALSERLGDIQAAIQAALKAAELYINQREVEKAIQNWTHVITLDPEHVLARSRLALVYERLNQPQKAVTEYLALASVLQRSGYVDKAQAMLAKAEQLLPQNAEVKQAKALLQSGQLLPKPLRPKGGTGPIRMAQVKQVTEATMPIGMDPIAEAHKKALTRLADLLFEISQEQGESGEERRDLRALLRGTGRLSQQADQRLILLHLGQAIDAHTRGEDNQAAEELEHVLEAGFDHAAVHFLLGYLRFQIGRLESAQRRLQAAVKHADLALGTRLLLGKIHLQSGEFQEAAVHFLEALRLADSMVAPEEQREALRRAYEPLIEAHRHEQNETVLRQVCDNVQQLLLRSDWRTHLVKVRSGLPATDGMPTPVAEVILQAQSSAVLDEMNRVHQLVRQGHLRAAMEEAFFALNLAPTYIPLHDLIAEILVQQGNIPEAIAKLQTIARTYSIRGDSEQATRYLERILQIDPLNLEVRLRLAEALESGGQIEAAVRAYVELAEVYSRLADLEQARKVYTQALRLTQQHPTQREWSVRILRRMADIDMQRLDWKQAVRVFEQIRTLQPDDEATRRQLVELNLRLGQEAQARIEMESYLTYLESTQNSAAAILFLEELIKEHPQVLWLRKALAELYRRLGRVEEAVAQYDAIGDMELSAGNRLGAIEAIQAILALNPPNAEEYRAALAQLQGRM
ncbi:MAG: tetratricopeptide repeat protein [Anaerolineales bacterium]